MTEHLIPRRPSEMISDGIGENRANHAVTIGTRTNEKLSEAEEQEEELLPGILNEISLNHITTKLPWSALCILPCLSREWRRAIQKRRVYDARVRTYTTETLLLHPHYPHSESHRAFKEIAMFSMRDKRCYVLPPIPQPDGIPVECNFVHSDGKIYLLAAGKEYCRGYVEVYVLDLAGQRQWKQCASMPETRQRFGCGAVDGKVYIFGGVDSRLKALPGSEVYDPEVNAWSPIKPMPRMRTYPFVDVLGDELFVHGGTHYHPDYTTWSTECDEIDRRVFVDFLLAARVADVYHPATDEWRLTDPFETESYEVVFGAPGQFFAISPEGINVFDTATQSWKDLHSHSFANLFASETGPIDDVRYLLSNLNCFQPNNGLYFLRSKGFLGKNREVSWRNISSCSRTHGELSFSIEL